MGLCDKYKAEWMDDIITPPPLSSHILLLCLLKRALSPPRIFFVSVVKDSPPLSTFDLGANTAPNSKFGTIPTIYTLLPKEPVENQSDRFKRCKIISKIFEYIDKNVAFKKTFTITL